MPTIQEGIEVLITGKAQGFVQAARSADSELGRLQTRMASFRELGANFGERYERGFETIKGALEGAGEEQAVLARAVGAFKGAISGNELEEWSRQLERITGVRHDRLESLASILGTLGANPEQAESLVGPILNVEQALKATGVSAEGMARMVAVALKTGNVGRLGRLGLFDERQKAEFEAAGSGAEGYAKRLEILRAALEKTGGHALADFRQTLPGATQALDTSLATLRAALAEPLVKPITDLANAATSLVYGFEQLPAPIKEVVAWGGVALVGALGLASLAFKGLAFWQSYQIAKLIEATQETNQLTAATDRLAVAQGRAAGAAAGEGAAESGVAAAGAGAAGRKAGGRGGFFGGPTGQILGSLGIELGSQWVQHALGETDFGAPDKSFGRVNTQLKNVGFRAAQGAGFGAFAGPAGAIPGALIGAVGGAIENVLHDVGVLKSAAKQSPEAEAADKLKNSIDRLTGATEKNTQEMSRSAVVSTSEVSLYKQLSARRVQQFSR